MKAAFFKALRMTITLMLGVLFLGVGYGVYMRSLGYDAWYPLLMAATIFAGSMEFITVGLLQEQFSPIYAFLLTLIVNGRHSFYGLSIYDRYNGTGWKKFFLVSMILDESFSVNCTTEAEEGVRQDWFMLFVSVLLYLSWLVGTSIGALFGQLPVFDVKGMDFVMTALFIVIFISNWQKEPTHGASLLGIGASVLMLIAFGPVYFLLPTLVICTLVFAARWRLYDDKAKLV